MPGLLAMTDDRQEVIEDITEAFSTESWEEQDARYLGWLRDLFVLAFRNDASAMNLLRRYRKFVSTGRGAPMTREALEERILRIVREKIEPSLVRYRGHKVVWVTIINDRESPMHDPRVEFKIFSHGEFPTAESVLRYKAGGVSVPSGI